MSLSKYVPECQECQRILEDSGLSYQLHANGTNAEGEWELVFKAIRRCNERIHEMGAPRISTSIKVGTRVDRNQRLQDKINSVRSKF